METKFSFRTRNDRAALRALCRAADKNLRLTRNRRKLYVGFAVVFSLLLVLRGLRLAQAGRSVLGDAVQVVYLFLVVYCLLRWQRAGSGRALEAQVELTAKQLGMETEVRASFSDEEIRFVEDGTDECLRYAALTKLVDCEGHYLLFVAPAEAYIISQRGIIDGELGAFERFLQQKTGLAWERLDT